jgi:predicted anti-sigma-YlaC factor YlaD
MSHHTPTGPDDAAVPPGVRVPCVEVLAVITDYLEGALPPARASLIDEHLAACDGCRTVLDQWHTVIDLAGHVTTDDLDRLDPRTRAGIVASFRARRGPA